MSSPPVIKDLLMAIDIGNTHVVLGIFKGDSLLEQWRLATAVSRTSDEAWIIIRSLCQDRGVDTDKIGGLAISSVVPDLTSIFVDLGKQYFDVTAYEVRADTTPSVKIQYRPPAAVGADRICNAAAGYERNGGPLIIVDFGTATTFDVVDEAGVYLGGVITPGVELTQKILHARAAKLPKVRLEFPAKIIADTTESSIQAGLMYGAVDELEGMCRRIWEELGMTGKVIATGGLSTLVSAHTKMIDKVESHLVLEGLRILYGRHCQ